MLSKVCFIIGSRANYSSIKSVMCEVKNSPSLTCQLVLYASSVLERYGEVSDLISEDGFEVNEKIFNLIEGESPLTMAKSTGLGLIELAGVFSRIKPDLVFAVGDRFEVMSIVLAASYMNIPIAHTMGGEVTGTIDESIRHSITKMSHIHFPASADAASRIQKMGEEKSSIFNVGCPRIDLVKEILNSKKKIDNQKINHFGVGDELDFDKPFVIVSQHPVTTEFHEAEEQMNTTLKVISKFELQFLVLWPNADAGSAKVSKAIRKFREFNYNKKIRFFKNISLFNYINLLSKCHCILGNSSSGIREGNFIGVPCVNIGSRQNGRQRGNNVIDVNHNYTEISDALKLQLTKKKYKSESIYGNGNSAKNIIKILKQLEKINIQKKITY